MFTARRKAKQAALDGLMKMLGNMDSQRMQAMQAEKQFEDGSRDFKGSAQLPDANDAAMVLQAKGSDSDISENTLNQPKAAPPNQDPSDGDPEGENLLEKDDVYQPLRDNAMRGDSTSRRILELFADEPENDEDETTELEPSADTVTSTEPGEYQPEIDEEYRGHDFEPGEEDAADRLSPVREKDLGVSRGQRKGYIGGDEGREAGQVTMSIKMPRKRR